MKPKKGVEEMRRDIDKIDAKIRLHLLERRRVSQAIRAAKKGTGLPDTDIAREKQLLTDYKMVLGDRHGYDIGRAVLAFSKDKDK